MNNKLLGLVVTALLLLIAVPGQADDTDIYYATGTEVEGAEPMVMFSLDWRPNLGSTACGGDECNFLKGEDFCWVETDDAGVETTACGQSYTDAGGARQPFLPVQDSYVYFDLLRAVLRKVMDPLDGLRVGLMLNHDYKNNCEGNVSSGCSNGGYMALGFQSFQADDANGAKAAFHEFLANIPVPGGNASHKYQGKELFFEMFRYLTGQGILNGHVGFLDYNGYEGYVSGDGSDGDTGGGGDDGGDTGTPVTETFCQSITVKGTTKQFCQDVTYTPETETVNCVISGNGNNINNYSMTCTVSTL